MLNTQLNLFDPPPAAAPPPAPKPAPTQAEIEALCTRSMLDGNRSQVHTLLIQLRRDGHAALVIEICRLRRDFGFRANSGGVIDLYSPGSKVEIIKPGQFYGKHARIVSVTGTTATVTNENWVVEHQYQLCELSRIKDDLLHQLHTNLRRGNDAPTG